MPTKPKQTPKPKIRVRAKAHIPVDAEAMQRYYDGLRDDVTQQYVYARQIRDQILKENEKRGAEAKKLDELVKKENAKETMKFAKEINESGLLLKLEELLNTKCAEDDPDYEQVKSMQEGLQMTHGVLQNLLKQQGVLKTK